MSATATINALQTLHAGLSGVNSAPQLASYPADVNTSTLAAAGMDYPLILTFVSNGIVEGSTLQGRTYLDHFAVLVLVGRSNQTNVAASQPATAALLDTFREAYTANLQLSSSTYHVEIEHSGWRDDINVAGTALTGIVFILRVKEQS